MVCCLWVESQESTDKSLTFMLKWLSTMSFQAFSASHRSFYFRLFQDLSVCQFPPVRGNKGVNLSLNIVETEVTKTVMTLCFLYCRLNGSKEVFESSHHSNGLRCGNMTNQHSQKLIHSSNLKQFQICALSGPILVCLARKPPLSSYSWCEATWGEVWPQVPALTS